MSTLTVEDLKELGYYIKEAIQEEFRFIHLSGNLANTVKIEIVDNKKVKVVIPAETYNLAEYRKNKVIVHDHKGSYADIVNKTGGFSKTHQNFVDRCTQTGLQKWLATKNEKVKVESIGVTINGKR